MILKAQAVTQRRDLEKTKTQGTPSTGYRDV